MTITSRYLTSGRTLQSGPPAVSRATRSRPNIGPQEGGPGYRTGFVTLPCREREVSASQQLTGRCDCGPPRGHRVSAKRAVRVGGDETALDVEGVVDGGVCGKKFLGRPRALEPLHLALPPPRWLMRILSSIVFPSPALMPTFHPKLSSRGAV